MKVSIEYDKNGKDKVKVKIESRDLWSGDVALARVIYPFLKKYRNLYNGKNPMCGYPMAFSPDPCKPEGPDNPDRFDEWLICLDKMIYSFDRIAHPYKAPYERKYHKNFSAFEKKYKKELTERNKKNVLAILDLVREKNDPLFDSYHKKSQEDSKKVQEGLDLFAKHYRSLWT